MNDFKEKFLAKIENKGSKKTIENLVVFVIILIATIIFINYIWKDDKKNSNKTNPDTGGTNTTVNAQTLAQTTTAVNRNEDGNDLESQIENILKKLEGVSDVSVLITYEETNKVVPMYNEENQESTTEEEDTQGGTRVINESTSKKEIIYEESNGEKTVVTSKVVTPEIKGAVIMAKGASNTSVKSNIILAVEAATGLPTHKIQVFEMK